MDSSGELLLTLASRTEEEGSGARRCVSLCFLKKASLEKDIVVIINCCEAEIPIGFVLS